MDILRELWLLFYDWFMRISARPGFWVGFVFGAVAFAGVAFVVFQVQVWWGQVTAIFKPLKVTHTTSATPAQVASGSCRAFVVGLVVLAFIVCVLIGIVSPGILEGVF
jgi:hypothetical protein